MGKPSKLTRELYELAKLPPPIPRELVNKKWALTVLNRAFNYIAEQEQSDLEGFRESCRLLDDLEYIIETLENNKNKTL